MHTYLNLAEIMTLCQAICNLQIVTPLLEKRNKNVSYDVPFIPCKMDLQETHITRLRHRQCRRRVLVMKRGY